MATKTMIAHIFVLLYLVMLVAAKSNTDEWNDFTNNFATDLAPIITLFGEQVTKQFLSESTSFVHNIIFGVAPLGILTAVVSVIRIYGNASLKSFIGRAQEAHGAAEAELCSSTSDDVCELWSNGGICRVFGRPKILEFMLTRQGNIPTDPKDKETQWKEFYTKFSSPSGKGVVLQQPSCGIHLTCDILSEIGKNKPGGATHSTEWEEVNPKKLDEHQTRFAPYPNLSLNIGIRTVDIKVMYLAATFGVCLQLSFFVYATWTTFYSQGLYEKEDRPQLWSFCLAVSGTTLLVVGMILCAWLIERKSRERSFTTTAGRTVMFWLQPGNQRIGDQLFNAFAYSETRDKYVTSWRLDPEQRQGRPGTITHSILLLCVAVSLSMVGFICQFIGLRGLHGSVALYQVASTLCMAIIRALLRTRRLEVEKSRLKSISRKVEGYELDWQALHIEDHEERQSSDGEQQDNQSNETGWHISHSPIDGKRNDRQVNERYKNVEVLGLNQSSLRIIGFRPVSDGSGGTQPDADVCCAIAAVEWIRFNEMDETNNFQPNEAARILHFRSRLAYLTDSSVASYRQNWNTEIRAMALRLSEALQQTADYIFYRMELTGDWKAATALAWSVPCERRSSTQCQRFPIQFLMHRNNNRWRVSKYQIEAALGLWLWSLGDRDTVSRKFIVVERKEQADSISALHLWVTQTDTITPTKCSMPKNPTQIDQLSIPLSSLQENTTDPSEPENQGVLLSIETNSSLLQMAAQDIFTIFISRISNILEPFKDVSQRQPDATYTDLLGSSPISSYLGLTNIHIQSISNILTTTGVASQQEDALMSIIPSFLQHSKLPQLDSVMGKLLAQARSLRRGKKFQQGEQLLKSLLSAAAPRFQKQVIGDLGELYRAAVRSPKSSEHDFGLNGLKTMKETCETASLLDEARQILPHYETVRAFFENKENHSITHQIASMFELDFYEFASDLKDQEARPLGLMLIDGIHLSNETKTLKILKWAIESDCPELIEDLWEADPTLIGKTDDEGQTPLFWAVSSDTHTLQRILEWPKILIDMTDKQGRTALLVAVQRGYEEAAIVLLEQGANTEVVAYGGDTLLKAAVGAKDAELLKWLVQEDNLDANKMIDTEEQGSVLAAIAAAGRTDIIQLLIQEYQADVNMVLQHGISGSALATACQYGNLGMVKFLVQEGKADVNMVLLHGRYGNALAAAATAAAATPATEFSNLEMVKFLVQEGKADVNMVLLHGEYGSALAAAAADAAYRGNLEVVKFLVQEGKADVNMVLLNQLYGSALAAAAAAAAYYYFSNLEVVKFLVQEGKADVNMVLLHGEYGSALAAAAAAAAAAAYYNKLEVVKFLVQEGKADVNMVLLHGRYGSALAAAAAARYSHLGVVKFLVQEGKADVNMVLLHGRYGSALVAAAAAAATQNSDLEVVKFLVQEGKADVNMMLLHGKYGSALAAAAQYSDLEVVKFLVQEGKADVNMVLLHGKYGSALAAAAQYSDLEVVKFLVQEGKADVNMVLLHGDYGSALAAATEYSNLEVVKFLVQEGKADVNMVLLHGDYGSALAAAATAGGGALRVVRFLVQEGKADVNMVLQHGNYASALAAAEACGNHEVINFLQRQVQ